MPAARDICSTRSPSPSRRIAIRALMRGGADPVKRNFTHVAAPAGAIGEPTNPEAGEWPRHAVGDDRRRPIVDAWRLAETGGALISSPPGRRR